MCPQHISHALGCTSNYNTQNYFLIFSINYLDNPIIFFIFARKNRMSTIDNESYRKIHFAVMAIESGAKKLNISGQEMERRLKEQDLIHQRLIGQYEILHTQSLIYTTNLYWSYVDSHSCLFL